MFINFYKLTLAKYKSLSPKDAQAFYYITNTGDLYQGEKLLNYKSWNGTQTEYTLANQSDSIPAGTIVTIDGEVGIQTDSGFFSFSTAEVDGVSILIDSDQLTIGDTATATTTFSTISGEMNSGDTHAALFGKIKKKLSDIISELGNKVNNSSIGSANGVAELDENGKVPSSQLPSYVDDVVEGYYNEINDRFYEEDTFETLITPEGGKSWVDIASNKSYRWTGSGYVRVDEGVQLGETSSTAYRGDRGKTAYDDSQTNKTAIGTLANLETTNKTNLVGAINEVNGSIATSVSGKADKVANATNGNFAGLDASGNLTDSGKKASDFVPEEAYEITGAKNLFNYNNETFYVPSTERYKKIGTANLNAGTYIISVYQDNQLQYGVYSNRIGYKKLPSGEIVYGSNGGQSPGYRTQELTVSEAGQYEIYYNFYTSHGTMSETVYLSQPMVRVKGTDNTWVPYAQTNTMLTNSKADKAANATNGHIAALDANGNIVDSGKSVNDFLPTTAGDGINISNGKISTDNMPSTDMSEIVEPKPAVMSRRQIYSTDEQVVGTWIDGKTLYQKTISTTLPNATTDGTEVEKSVLINASVDNIILLNGIVTLNGSVRELQQSTLSGNVLKSVRLYANTNAASSNKNTVFVRNSWISQNGATTYITIRYTKTTD